MFTKLKRRFSKKKFTLPKVDFISEIECHRPTRSYI